VPWLRFVNFVCSLRPQNRYRDRRWLRSSRFHVPGGFILSAGCGPFSRAHLDRIELPAGWRDLLVRCRATASRAEWVSARPFSAAAIWYGSSPGAERQVLWGLRLSSDVDLVVTRWTTRCDRASVVQAFQPDARLESLTYSA
jgi:hypothetical protein